MAIKLDIVSDPICPWCYIGKANLDRVLLERPGHSFDIVWHPYQLNYDMPAGGMDRRTYLETKFGGADEAMEAYRPVIDAAESAGLDIAWDRIARTPNTLDAHRLIHWAGIEGRQTACVSALFEAYFQRGADIGDPEVLADVAERIEMDADMARRLLATDADRDEILTRDARSRERGIQGVPTFIVAEHHAVSGAQPPDLWRAVLDEVGGAPA